MGGFHFLACRRGSIAARLVLACCLIAVTGAPLPAQSTFGTILGTVTDMTGAMVVGAPVTLLNNGTATTRTVQTDSSGSFAFKNLEIDKYSLTVNAPGFQLASLAEIALTARETRHLNVVLKPSGETQTVEVVDNALAVISTEVSNLAETKIGDELVELPVAIYSRSSGSTSPISTLTTEAGVETDDSGNLAVMGTTAALLSVTIDGISSVGVEYSGPVNEMFPSFNSIEEIRVSESNNNAEFSGVADITTVSKAGSLHYHGGAFENNENTVFNSNDAFALTKPRIIMNDFGATLGGPLAFLICIWAKAFSSPVLKACGCRAKRRICSACPRWICATAISAVSESDLLHTHRRQSSSLPQRIHRLQSRRQPAHRGRHQHRPRQHSVPVNPLSAQLLTALMPMPNYGDPSADFK